MGETKDDRTYLDTSDGMSAYAERHGAKLEKATGRWYVDGEVPPELVGLIPKKPNKAVHVVAPSCPRCGGSTIQRNGPTGPFWGCTRYPRCKGTVDYEEHLDPIHNMDDTQVGSLLARRNAAKDPSPPSPTANGGNHADLPRQLRLEVERIVALAIALRGGERQAQKWLNSPMVRFKGNTPLSMMTTIEGCRAVEDLLQDLVTD
jgi:hypothetical protein